MAAEDTAFTGTALAVMRTARGWRKKELAAALGLRPAALYGYEKGAPPPSRAFLERAARAMGLPGAMVERTLSYLRHCAAGAAADPESAEIGEIDEVAAELGAELEGFIRSHLTRLGVWARAVEERQRAPGLWARLAPCAPAERQAIVRLGAEFRSWGLAELLAHESVAAAPASAGVAMGLAELAVLVAGLAPGTPAWRSRVEGYARFHLGNARRVQGDLPTADAAFRRAAELWAAGAPGDPERLLDEARVLDLEASLRREQRRLPEALALLDRALAVDRSGSRAGRILVIRAKTLEEMDDYEGAIATLERALPLVDGEREPHLLWSLRFNLLENLHQVGRHAEAEAMLAEVRALALRLGNDLDLVRLVWLEGRIARGFGRRDEAAAALAQVRRDFVERKIPYDAALAGLELGVLLLEEGRVAEVAALANETYAVFKAQQVDREALAALALFRDAAAGGTLTVELARQLLADFEALAGRRAAGRAKEGPGPGRQRPRAGGKEPARR